MDFISEKSVLRVNLDFMGFLFTVRLGNPKKDLQNYSREQWSFAKYACAYKTAVLKDSFSNPFSDFPIERLKSVKIQKQIFQR